MESHGWRTTGRMGSLGVWVKGPTRTTPVVADHNAGWRSPLRTVEERVAEIELETGTVASRWIDVEEYERQRSLSATPRPRTVIERLRKLVRR